ncbi:MAG TPA: metal ABC transporter ATP-binding protein [Pyrinomonadaceae bacterium]|jgi:zinc transport system ATP-binding protein|nr:metal ABC transporter ATP-binding protein [Pyrinomonadaceae bacterium]
MNLLTVKHLSVQLEDRSIVEDLSFELEPGERLSILGPNGAGKTVLLKALLGLLRYRGEIIWSREVRIGYVPQKIDADTHLPLTFTDLFRAKCHALKVALKQIDDVAGRVGLTKQVMKTPVGHLSGGQFQRGLIGYSLLGDPNVLLMDEPTASVDEPGEEHIYELINRLQTEQKLASIMVSHDLSFVFRYATNVLCLNRQQVCFGSPREALSNDVLTKLYGESVGFYDHHHT